MVRGNVILYHFYGLIDTDSSLPISHAMKQIRWRVSIRTRSNIFVCITEVRQHEYPTEYSNLDTLTHLGVLDHSKDSNQKVSTKDYGLIASKYHITDEKTKTPKEL